MEQNPQNDFERSHILGNILDSRIDELQKFIHSLTQTPIKSFSNNSVISSISD